MCRFILKGNFVWYLLYYYLASCCIHDQSTYCSWAAILKGSDFSVLDRAECQFATTATVLDNGSQVIRFHKLAYYVVDFWASILS